MFDLSYDDGVLFCLLAQGAGVLDSVLRQGLSFLILVINAYTDIG